MGLQAGGRQAACDWLARRCGLLGHFAGLASPLGTEMTRHIVQLRRDIVAQQMQHCATVLAALAAF